MKEKRYYNREGNLSPQAEQTQKSWKETQTPGL